MGNSAGCFKFQSASVVNPPLWCNTSDRISLPPEDVHFFLNAARSPTEKSAGLCWLGGPLIPSRGANIFLRRSCKVEPGVCGVRKSLFARRGLPHELLSCLD